MKRLKKLLLSLFLCSLFTLTIALGAFYMITKDVYLEESKLILNENTLLLYDRCNARIENPFINPIKQTTKLDDIPSHTQMAFVCTEDKNFYLHNGFDFKRILKASINNLKAKSFKEGASTISQQLIKNTHLTQEKTIQRKLKEWKLTNILERNYSKEEILEKYLNSIYFGHSCFGIQSAAEFYFSKLPHELDVSDSAILAGLIKSPNYYSPFLNPTNCQKRKNLVLTLMRKRGIITEEEYQIALNETLPTPLENTQKNAGFLSFVFDELSEIFSQKQLRLSGKIEIYTELDKSLQTKLEEETFHCNENDKTIMVLDANSHHYTACVSTVGNIQRLPGSIIKPLLVYAPALEENILTPATPILDEKIKYGDYTPDNYDKQFHGYVSARECVAQSLNIPSVKILQSLGIEKGTSYLKKMNLETKEEDKSLALALGGMKKGFYFRDLVSAYATFCNEGNYINNGFIKEIKLNGKCIYQCDYKKRAVFSPETTYLMTDMLKTTTQTGTAKKLRTLPFEVAAKTGTVGTSKGNTDAYAISYTPQYVVGVWIGNADNTSIPYTGGGLPCQFLSKIHEYLYEKKHPKTPIKFQKPKNIERLFLDKFAYYDTHTILLADDLAPKEYCLEEIFNKKYAPTKKSDYFSNPHISSPNITLSDNSVIITLQEQSPTIYQYKIDRYDYTTHTTVYHGDYSKIFIDDTIERDKKYLYTITPIYHKKSGSPILLPEVNTARSKTFDQEIIEKDWWNE